MRTKLIRVEQKEADMGEVDRKVNQEIEKLEKAGHEIKNIEIAVGRDADITAKLKKNFSMTVVLLYE